MLWLIIGLAATASGSRAEEKGPVGLTRNINQGSGGSGGLGSPVAFGSRLFFVTDDGEAGWEIWQTDGTEAGTFVVTDVHEGGTDALLLELTALGDHLYFTADSGGAGRELWRTDGSPGAEELVADIRVGSEGSDPEELTRFGGQLFFVADDGVSGPELWRSDGSAAGTSRVKDIFPGAPGSSPEQLTVFGRGLLFVAEDEAHGAELWRSDGTEAGTALLLDIYSGVESAAVSDLTALPDGLYFGAWDGETGGLWRSDGSAAGSALIADLELIGYNLDDLTAFHDRVVFSTFELDAGFSIWSTDGTLAGTTRLATLGSGASIPLDDAVHEFTVVGDQLFFRYFDLVFGNRELWRSDGTAAGTALVRTFDSEGPFFEFPTELTSFEDALYFLASDDVSGSELFRSDGTFEGTVVAAELVPGELGGGPLGLFVAGGSLFFTASDLFHGREPWVSDGTTAGSYMVADLNDAFLSSEPWELAGSNGRLFFRADDAVHGVEPWTSDGSEQGTRLVKDIEPDQRPGYGSYPGEFTAVGGITFFVAGDENGAELWRTDGTEAGTSMVSDIHPGGSSDPQELTAVGDLVFFTAFTVDEGRELWKSDGTEVGTELVVALEPGGEDHSFGDLVDLDGTLLFSTIIPAALYRTDGTPEGTLQLASVYSGFAPVVLDGKAYFEDGTELWSSDGTVDGTGPVADLGGSLSSILVAGPRMFITVFPHQLWVSDGTPVGTTLVQDFDSFSSGPQMLSPLGADILLSVGDEQHGEELWRSDGTPEGTFLLEDINSGPDSSSPSWSASAGGVVLFSAYSAGSGRELWRTDGTAEGTQLVADIRADDLGSSPEWLVSTGDEVFFMADDGVHGEEVWRAHVSTEVVAVDRFLVEGDSGPTPGTVELALTRPTVLDVVVDWQTADGSAEAGNDYHAASGDLEIPFGSVAAAVPVELIGDREVEPDEIFRLEILSVVNADVADPSADVTILTDEWQTGDCGFPDSLRLHHRSVAKAEQFQVCRLLDSDHVTVESAGELILLAGEAVRLDEGFVVEAGGKLLVGGSLEP